MHARRDPDYFARSRMPLEDHLEELAWRLRRALACVVGVMIAGITIDLIGMQTGHTELGFAFPVLRTMTAPAEREVEAFYLRRYEEIATRLHARPGGVCEPLVLGMPNSQGESEHVMVDVDPVELARVAKLGELRGGFRRPLSTLSAPEAMMTYCKVAFVVALVIASPYMFYQMWAFVAAGLYPHEKRYVYIVLPASVGLFLAGVALCQFVVLPSAVRALLAFNDWPLSIFASEIWATEQDLRLSPEHSPNLPAKIDRFTGLATIQICDFANGWDSPWRCHWCLVSRFKHRC